MALSELQRRFIDVLVASGALLEGEFTLKSGITSRYFVDFGAVGDGENLTALGECFADAIVERLGTDGFDVVFGPAYKAIPIAAATAIGLRQRHGTSKRFAFNRKVAKTYGEGRQLLGGVIEPADRVVIVDDVFTEGGAKVETLELLRAGADPAVVAVLVGVDRAEPGALERFAQTSGGVPVHAICGMADVRAAFGHT